MRQEEVHYFYLQTNNELQKQLNGIYEELLELISAHCREQISYKINYI